MRKINNTFGTSNRKNAFRIRNEMKKKKKNKKIKKKKKKKKKSSAMQERKKKRENPLINSYSMLKK